MDHVNPTGDETVHGSRAAIARRYGLAIRYKSLALSLIMPLRKRYRFDLEALEMEEKGAARVLDRVRDVTETVEGMTIEERVRGGGASHSGSHSY